MVTLGQGLGVAMSLLSWTTSLHSLVPLAWALKLLVASTNNPLPWLHCRSTKQSSNPLFPFWVLLPPFCRQPWNDNLTCSELVAVGVAGELEEVVGDILVNWELPEEQYLSRRVLRQGPGHPADLQGELVACLAVLSVWIYFTTWKRRKASSVSRQASTIVLYTLMLALGISNLRRWSSHGQPWPRPGAEEGVRHFFTPSLEGLTSPTTLLCAMGYLCNLFGLGCGVPIELAASNHFNYRHLVKVVSIGGLWRSGCAGRGDDGGPRPPRHPDGGGRGDGRARQPRLAQEHPGAK